MRAFWTIRATRGFTISACNVAAGNEKGRVENGVGYVKKNFLNGLELADFSAVNPAALLWLETVANVRIHSETRQRPADMFEQEKTHLLPLNPSTYDIARIISAVRVSKLFRVALDTNQYSVPVQYSGVRVTLKVYPDRVCIYHAEQLIARHDRCYDRHKDKEDPNHPKELITQRRNANEQRLLLLPYVDAKGRRVSRGSLGTARELAQPCCKDQCACRNLRRPGNRTRDRGRPGIRCLQLRIHHLPARNQGAGAARSRPLATDATAGLAGT